MSVHHSNTIVKFTYNTIVVRLISEGDESTYRSEVDRMTVWCKDNNLLLNVIKTKELIVYFRKKEKVNKPLHINEC